MDEVTRVANVLERTELEVFQKACESWYGYCDELGVEQDYSDYIKHGRFPHYVRHYCRQVPDPPDDYTQQFIKMVKRWIDME